MKLIFETDKFYKTRDGRKVKFLGDFSDDVGERYPLLFVFDKKPLWFTSDGYQFFDIHTDADIVSEWKEPMNVSGWINVSSTGYPQRPVEFFNKYSDALNACVSLNRAYPNTNHVTIFVSGTEGEELKE